ncbi:MAG: hypothetical protein M1819_005028 [Sarea resinae]|nr:MAG: hypothetical protein M1819_005028 [Sarea resinae]
MDSKTLIERAFDERPKLKKRIYDAIREVPKHADLFHEIAEYTYSLRADESNEPAAKKRKHNDNADASNLATNGSAASAAQTGWRVGKSCFTAREISFSVPARKKFTLEMTAAKAGGIRAVNPTTDALEFGIAWGDIAHVVCLPVPEKAQRAYNFCVFPSSHTNGIVAPAQSSANAVSEPMVWTVPDAPPKTVFYGSEPGAEAAMTTATEGETYETLTRRKLNEILQPFGKSVVVPDEREFASSIVQAHRKGEKAFHVKAFRGSKDGFLFFLPSGIIFGFKKPLYFFAFDDIVSISYTSVLQRTFNLNITATTSSLGEEETPESESETEFEFSMLDQADFGGIDAYVRAHGLQDASMAEQRKAKRLNINPAPSNSANPNTNNASSSLTENIKNANHGVNGSGADEEEEEEEGELAKAARLLPPGENHDLPPGDEDDDDEDEEDYDPGSEGESEGSGVSSGSEEGEGDGGDEDDDQEEEEEEEDEL